MEAIYQYLIVFITAIFVNNVVLSQILGICPFLGVSKKINTALGMSGAVAFVLVLATLVTYLLQYYVLKKVSPSLYQALGVFLPLITTNCAVLGVAILVIQKEFNLMMGVWYARSTAVGVGLALVIFAGIREQLNLVSVPKGMQGMSIALVTAGLLAMAFMGFSGVDNGLKAFLSL